MKLYTIGFTKKSANEFFDILISNNVKRLIDVRLNNKSQLAGFAKSEDLQYFLKKIGQIDYIYMSEFAPTDELLGGYRKKQIGWDEYEKQYCSLLAQRDVLKHKNVSIFDNACLLCSEPIAKQCHRRLAAEYIARSNKDIKIIHL
ncbi:MAG: DUF488 domain-containing protein [Candidatus Omnitrophica bacterium]|nr:DUF488 domain-containing protein [Candidatus Omnitrophota bacterium]